MCSRVLRGSIECWGTSALSSCLRDEVFGFLTADARFVTEPEGVEARDREDERGLRPGRGGKGRGAKLAERRGNGELAPDREEGDGGFGLRSCSILTV